MNRKLKTFFSQHGVLVLALLCIILGFTGIIDSLVSGYKIIGSPKSLFHVPAFSLMSGFLLAGSVCTACLFILNYFRQVIPVRKLKETGIVLSRHDFPALARGLSNLTLGNLTQKIHLHSEYPPSKVPANILPLAEALHVLRDNLNVIVDNFTSVTDPPCKRVGFIGSDPVADGKKCAVVLSEMVGIKGKILIATGFRFDVMMELRRKSFEQWIRLNTDLEIVDVLESMLNRDLCKHLMEDIFHTHPDLKGIYATDAVTTSIIAEILSMHSKRRNIRLLGHDLNIHNVRHLKSGSIDALLNQNSYIQGYDTVIYLYNHLVEGWIPPKPQIFIPAEVITQQNINQHWHQSQKYIISHELLSRLTKPTETPPTRTYKIAFLGREDSEIWKQICEGATAAGKVLASKNVILEWIVPEEAHEKSDFSAMVYSQYIERCMKEGIDGLITFVEDARLIFTINKAVKAGIQVMTVNTEPLNLRSLIQTLNDQTSRLSRISKDLGGNTQHTIISTTEIRNSISKIADGSITQNNQVDKTRTTLESLLSSIDQISHEANESENASEDTGKAVAIGTSTMEQTLQTLDSIAKSVNNSWSVVEELRQHSNRIDDIVDILDTIGSKVNILALNASIEATQSGSYEKRFGQVASEIRKLAMNTSEANRDVSLLVETLKMDIQKVQKTMQTSVDMIKNIHTFTSETDSSLDNIQMLVDADKSRIRSIAQSIHEMQSLSHQVGYSMDHMVMVSAKNSTSVNQVNVSVKDMVSRLEDVRRMANHLENMAKSESEFLAMFETEEKAG